MARVVQERPLRRIAAGSKEIASALGFYLTHKRTDVYQTIEASRGWHRVHEPFTGAWQRNIVSSTEDLLTYAAVYACVTLIASDIAKLHLRLVEKDPRTGIWTEVENAAHSPVLRKPNRFQDRIKFIEQWIVSKLIHGNTYILKSRDERNVVTAMYVLDPQRVRPMVAPDGSVFYNLSSDNLVPVRDGVSIPASEIIHDVMVPLYHPLCGVSPLTACSVGATQGLRVQNQSTQFFENGGTPSGVLTSPIELDDEQAKAIQNSWNEQFTGNNFGKVAVLGFGFTYQPMTMSAVDAQLIDQLKWTSENVCTAYHVPPYMVGVGPPPNYNNIEALNQQYYSQCLQILIESIESLLDEGLELKKNADGRLLGTELDLDDLLRMDTPNKVKAASEATKAGMSINEARFRYFDLPPVKGGETPYLQQQDWPIALLADRTLPEAPTTRTTLPAPEAAPEKELDPALVQKALDVALDAFDAELVHA